MKRRTWIPGILIAILAGTPSARGADLLVFAAASLTDALKEIRAVYEPQTGDRLTFNFDGSGNLARQIAEGAPADVFFSADEAKMDGLQEKQLIVAATRASILSNRLVVVAAADSPRAVVSPDRLAGPEIHRIALADPASVPAGLYAQAYLRTLGLWDPVAPKVVPLENVRSALAAIEAGNADVGFVYQTDAAASKKVKIVWTVPAGEGPSITYPAAVVHDTLNAEAAIRFLAFLRTSQSAGIFAKYGFTVLSP
jgi:molybdate transport system substrate-binding protein